MSTEGSTYGLDTGNPFDGGHAIPSRHQHPEGGAVFLRERCAVHHVDEQGVLGEGDLERQRATESVGRVEDDLDGVGKDLGRSEHARQRNAFPLRRAHRSQPPWFTGHRRIHIDASIAGALQGRRELATR